MAAKCFIALLLFVLASNTEDPQDIKAESGDDVTLQCRSDGDGEIVLLEWIRAYLKSDEYVFIFRDNRPYEDHQHPSFIGRVQLKDPEMKNRDVSVILKNVNINDTGSYKCHVAVDGKKVPELMNTIYLTVTETGDKEGGDKEGGDKEGGDKEGGDKQRGDKQGGDKEGGDKQGGDKEGGDKEGGDKQRGDKQGGDKEGNTGGHVGLIPAGVIVAVIVAVVIAVVGSVILYKRKKNPSVPPADEAADEQML